MHSTLKQMQIYHPFWLPLPFSLYIHGFSLSLLLCCVAHSLSLVERGCVWTPRIWFSAYTQKWELADRDEMLAEIDKQCIGSESLTTLNTVLSSWYFITAWTAPTCLLASLSWHFTQVNDGRSKGSVIRGRPALPSPSANDDQTKG